MSEYEISEDYIVKLCFESASIKGVINTIDNSLKPVGKETAAQKKRRAQKMVEQAVINWYEQFRLQPKQTNQSAL